MDSNLPPNDGTKPAPLWTLMPNLSRLWFFMDLWWLFFFVVVVVYFVLFLFWQSWPIFSQQPLIVGIFSLIAAEVQLCRTLFFDKQAFECWICFRTATSDFPASFTPITCFFWSRQISLDFTVVLFVCQSLKFQQLLTIRITLKM